MTCIELLKKKIILRRISIGKKREKKTKETTFFGRKTNTWNMPTNANNSKYQKAI